MWSLSSPLLRTNTVKSFRVPRARTLISSTTPLVFISVCKSYLGEALSGGFCAAPAEIHRSTETKIPRHGLRSLGCRLKRWSCRVMYFRSSDMASPSWLNAAELVPDVEGGNLQI